MMRKILLQLLFISFLQNAFAQQLQLTTYSQREGMPAYGANGIHQDHQGWMWFTTGYELIRYDGNQFKTFYPAADTPLEYCFDVFQVKGELWVNATPFLVKLAGDSLRKAGVENNTGGIVHYLEHSGQSYFLGRKGISILTNNKLEPLITDSSLSINRSESMEVYNDSLLVSHQYGKALLIFNLKKRSYESLPLEVTDLRKDRLGNILLMVKGTGILRLKNIQSIKGKMGIQTETVYRINDPMLLQFVMDPQGNCWMFRQFRGLVKLLPDNTLKEFNESHGLPSLWFNKFFVDREENIWIGFNSGLCKLRTTNWDRYTFDEGMYSNHINSFIKDHVAGRLYISTRSGLNVFDKGRIKQVRAGMNAFIADYILIRGAEIYFIRDSVLYSGFIDTINFQIRNEAKLTQLKTPGRQVFQGPEGNIFVSTTKGLFVLTGNQLTRVVPDTLYFREILFDSQNRLWAGDFVGNLHCYRMVYDKGVVQAIKMFQVKKLAANMPEVKQIRALAEDKQGNIFVGTRYSGLFVFTVQDERPVAAEHFGEKNGLPSNGIWSIAADPTAGCWIANAKGLIRMQKLNDRWIISDEGMNRDIFHTWSVFAAPDSSIWIGNHPGIVVIRNEHSKPSAQFSVFITSISVNGGSVQDTTTGGLRLAHNKNDVSVQFSANTYSNEETVLYSWRLDEDEKWSIPAAGHTVNFSSLKPGKYLFSVKAVNAEGQWSTNEAGFAFRVLPPFWQRAWFIALIVAVAGTGLYFLYRYRMKKLGELYNMRNSIARDLHDEIGSTLTSINILSKVSHRNLQKDDDKAAELLEKVIDQSQKIQQSMSDIVWAIKPDNDRMENMTVRMREYLSHTLEPGNISIEFSVDETVMSESLSMQQRRDFFLIFKEAVNNIAKYSRCRKAHIELQRHNGNIRLMIKDDGIGFDTNHFIAKGGLLNMQRRAELLKGSLQISSAAGKGTSIQLLVPATS